MDIKTIKVTDGGDGSTTMHLTYEDGTEDWLGEDVPYDGYVEFHFINNKHDSTTVEYG